MRIEKYKLLLFKIYNVNTSTTTIFNKLNDPMYARNAKFF